MLIELLLFIGIAVLLYTYFGYPLLLILISGKKESLTPEDPKEWPSVSLLVAAYNEARVIASKIENFRALDYPAEQLKLCIVSDGSNDATDEIVKELALEDGRVRLLICPRVGKAMAINRGLEEAIGEIVVFSDANTKFDPKAIRLLVKHFSREKVGCVSGRLVYANPVAVLSGKGEGAYWRYETALKKMESQLGFVAGANGAIYAIRRKLFESLPPRTINDDFLISMRIVAKGYESIFEEDALAYEDVAPDNTSEFTRHVRDASGHYGAIFHLLSLLNPMCGMRSFIYWSHRILRWLAPFVLIFLFVSNAFLVNHAFYAALFLLQLGFYLLAVLGALTIHRKQLPFLFYAPYYFCNLNLALLFGFFLCITGRQASMWVPTARTA